MAVNEELEHSVHCACIVASLVSPGTLASLLFRLHKQQLHKLTKVLLLLQLSSQQHGPLSEHWFCTIHACALLPGGQEVQLSDLNLSDQLN